MQMHKTLAAQYLKEHFFMSTKRRKIGGLKNYLKGGNLKNGEVNFERGL